ncbi:glutamyl-tRNA synthetase [Radiomyces spectabilis]|uniref:glutamyl-tRNA synthetase n=1 Tax=Radiomyces spectabilis TaxID=64574 RepID=UPI0022207E93|nr:glutamyl-tRNA synthetase [Radiomyces spectabilis]KAI8384338.1 glutamyl-tRNA synthetase [Radiomyces spectabilis]
MLFTARLWISRSNRIAVHSISTSSKLYRSHTLHFAARRWHHTPVRVRFAPSPTGQLHLGGLRTALFNYLLAKKTGGQFILRIEDTDQTRYVEGAVEKLVSALSWAGITYDEGPGCGGPHAPYYQSERTDLYRKFANDLIENGHAYRCFCTPERLQKVRESRHKTGRTVAYDKHCSYLSDEEIEEQLSQGKTFTVRLKVPSEGSTEFKDLVYGQIHFNNKTIEDTILLKSDGYPTYHLANVVDDHLMGITHVLRGEEWIASTPKHLLLYKALGWSSPHFAHLPLLLNADRTKLSKRTGDVHVEQYIAKGYLPEAVINFAALLSWHMKSEEEIYTIDQLIQAFDLADLNNSGAVVDIAKLDWFNKHHLLRRAETAEGLKSLVDMLVPSVHSQFGSILKDRDQAYRGDMAYLTRVVETIKDRIRNIQDIPRLCSYFFVDPDYTTAAAKTFKKKLKAPAIQLVFSPETQQQLSTVEPFDGATIKQFLHETAEKQNVNPNHVMMAMRYAVTGTQVGAGVADTMAVLGRQTCIDRITTAKAHQV